MIFVTVGAQMPFDRLIRAVDAWAAARGRSDLFAQVGDAGWRPRFMGWTSIQEPADFRQRLFEADAVVTHAGMGTILTALEFGKPVLVLPRRGDLRETRNDHQLDTARAFAESRRVAVAWDEHELPARLDALAQMPAPDRIPSHASLALLTAVRSFIRGAAAPPLAEAAAGEPVPAAFLDVGGEAAPARRAAA